MASYRITPRAKEDLLNIGRYTESRWGKDQRNRYLRQLEQRFAYLAKFPYQGKHRLDIDDTYYSYPEGEHLVFYLIHPKGVDIIGIPHKQMDIPHYFKEDLDS